MSLPKIKKRNIEKYVGGLSNFSKVSKPIKLSANESALGPSPRAKAIIKKEKNLFFRYPDSESSSLRDVISKKFNINPKKIICGAGSDQIIDLTCQLFLEKDDEVIVTEYGFIMYKIYSLLHKAKVLIAKEKNYKASISEILKKVTKKTKIVFIANPNNPTGTYLTTKEMLKLRKNLREDILLVVDDAYSEFLDKDDFTSGIDLFKNKENVLITKTFSKIYGLAGLRLGWGYSSKKIINSMYQIKPPFNVNRVAIASGIEAIKDNKWIIKAVRYNSLWSKKIFSVLKECKIKTNEPTANFFLMNFDRAKINSGTIFKKLAKKRLLVRNMTQYKIPNSLRMTIGDKKSNEYFIKCIRRLCK